MADIDVVAMLLSNSYTDESVIGGGAIKGSPCYIKKTTEVEEGQRITFAWTLTDNTERTLDVLLKNGKAGKDGDKGDDGRGIKDSYLNDQNHFIIVYDDDTEDDLGEITVVGVDRLSELKDVNLTSLKDGDVLVYDAELGKWVNGKGGSGGGGSLEDDLTTSVTVGGITSGTSYEEGTPLETIFRDMLNPVAYPTLTNPSATISATGAKLLESGSTLNTTMTITFNRGSINPQYDAESPYRSGEAQSFTLNGTTQASNVFPMVITSAKTSYQGSVAYGAGVQPKDSVGNNYNSPLPSGSVNTNTISYEFVDALYANTGNIASVTKLALVSKSAKVKEFSFPAQTSINPEEFHVASSWTITALEVLNTLSNQWENCASEFTVTDITHEDAGGNTVNYKKYLCNLGIATGARKIRIKWS